MNYLRSRSLKRLLSLGRRSNADESAEECVDVKPPPPPLNRPTWRCFSYEELHQATNGFHQDNMVGKGGYGEVYRGVLDDGRAVAVKRLAPTAAADEKKEKDFLTELGTVGHVRHPNVSALLGCCVDRGLHLVFEFSTRGSVSANLHDEKLPVMSWKQRHGIAVGTARGLRYLHKDCARRIIHRDIKASNVLLTADYEAQISDFGLARWLPSEWTHHAIAPIEGTFGCLAPEYFTHGIVDEKTDVFAFGVFLLELISGRKPVDGSHKSLIAWAKPYLTDGVVQGLVDPRLGDGYDAGQLRRLMFVASLCVRAAAAWRPTMTQVLELLESGEISQDQWQMPEKEEEDEFWDFDHLDDFEDDDDDNYDDESDSPSISSSACSIHPND
ncbi:probable receptor-like serine/threonine-protein kinase At5g57670 [Phragmites australis]|uniref:probable receptor-like serine/threonine-protein kinase At5g57670 n=1 Tax=Phragmites australis TaxID=29695 RepID=UPI002D7768E4|nr:probable receptor-like serine/threonine-protein kinase At5g57670 [Phragmites australis]